MGDTGVSEAGKEGRYGAIDATANLGYVRGRPGVAAFSNAWTLTVSLRERWGPTFAGG